MSAVVFTGVSKMLSLAKDRSRSFREAVVSLSPFRSETRRVEEFWALRDVSFQIDAGETVGFIGPNGAGKSSLLKLIARVFEPTSGHISVQGRVAALLELGTGFHPELSGRENIFLSGAIIGLTRPEIEKSVDSIVKFAGLGHFIDAPVKHYSSGMYVRLGFAVAIHTQPDILLIDEVLSVGDQQFQSRCMDKIAEMQTDGVTIILVSHDLGAVRRMCQRCIWLEDGQVLADGDTETTLNSYLSHVWAADLGTDEAVPRLGRRWGSGEARIERVDFLDAAKQPATMYRTGETFTARIWYCATRRIDRPSVGVAIYRDDGTHVTGPNTAVTGFELDVIDSRGFVDYTVDNLPLLPGQYEFSATLYDYHSIHPYDHRHRQFPFRVKPAEIRENEGVVAIPCRWEHHAIVDDRGGGQSA